MFQFFAGATNFALSDRFILAFDQKKPDLIEI